MRKQRRSRLFAALYSLSAMLVALAVLSSPIPGAAQTTLTVSAAASLSDALVDVETAYKRSHQDIVFVNNFASSGTLAAQIDQGAPVDVFISAATKQMDELEGKGLIAAGTRRNLLRNTLVLVAPLDSRLRDFAGLEDSSIRMIALGDPASVPAGAYGKQTLTALHQFDQLKAKLVLGKDVRQVLTYVETGNADAGLVYATDALASGKVRIVATAPESSHDSILYPMAIVKGSHSEASARAFLEYLGSPAGEAIFVKRGFTIATR